MGLDLKFLPLISSHEWHKAWVCCPEKPSPFLSPNNSHWGVSVFQVNNEVLALYYCLLFKLKMFSWGQATLFCTGQWGWSLIWGIPCVKAQERPRFQILRKWKLESGFNFNKVFWEVPPLTHMKRRMHSRAVDSYLHQDSPSLISPPPCKAAWLPGLHCRSS